MRRREFARVIQLIDDATKVEQSAPEVRYARALSALETNDVETALRLAESLSQDAPLFQTEASELRLEAAKRSRDLTLLLHFLGSSKKLSDRLLIAEVQAENANGNEARKIADEVLLALEKSKQEEALPLRVRAHSIKAKTFIAEARNAEAAREYHYLATEGASLDEQGEFDEKLTSLDPARKLTEQERLARLETFSKKGLIERTEKEIAALSALSPSAGAPEKTAAHLAWALYTSRTDYKRAAELFAQAASYGGPNKKEHLYYEAKSIARSHNDRDAIEKYETVASLGGSFADRAAFQAARLRFIDGQWKAAVTSFEKYLKTFGVRAQHREEAVRDLPIARLAAGDFSRASVELATLLKDEDSQIKRARLMQLLGVAKLGEKKNSEAAATFRNVIEYRPLSFPAMLAVARLKEMGEPIPPLLKPAPAAPASRGPEPPLVLSLPEKVWRLSRVGLDEQAEQSLRGEEPRIQQQYGARAGEALCRLYGQLESAQRRFQVAQTATSWSVLSHEPRPESEWQWECIYPTPYEKIATEEAKRHRLHPEFVYGVMRQESAFRPSVVSPAEAVGLLQIIPPTAQRIASAINATYSADLMRAPAVNISYGSYYLRFLLDLFENRPELAAAAYNAGPQAVTRWLRAGQKLPLDIFVAQIPYTETRDYVYQVMSNYVRYAYLTDKREVVNFDLKIPEGMKVPEDAY